MAAIPLPPWGANDSARRKDESTESLRPTLGAAVLVSLLFSAHPASIHAASPAPAGNTRTYYVAADEVQWDYAPSGRDEAMGMEFDDIGKSFTESGPHHIGHINKKAIYREYTDATFSTLKKRSPEERISVDGADSSWCSGRHD